MLTAFSNCLIRLFVLHCIYLERLNPPIAGPALRRLSLPSLVVHVRRPHTPKNRCAIFFFSKTMRLFQGVLLLPKINPSILLSTGIEFSVKNEILFSCSFTKAFQQNRLGVSPGKENDQKNNSIITISPLLLHKFLGWLLAECAEFVVAFTRS